MGHGELRWTGTQTAAAGANARAAAYTSAAERAPDPLAERASRGSHDRVHVAVTTDERDAFLALVLGPDDAEPARFIDRLLARGVEVGTIYLDLLGPTAVTLGDMWVEDTCDFFDVTIGVGRLQRAVRDLGQAFVMRGADATPAGRVLLSSLPGDQHTLGMFMVAEFLLRDGWGVRVGTPGTADDLAAMLRDEWFDVVGFSAACDVRLLALRHQVAAVRRYSRNPHVRVLVGGRVFVEHPELAARVGADAFATSAEDAPSRARALLDSRSS
ncbi:MAG TPA: cobalamin B12-binding domain-containing protein [Gemmatirosa sp.]